MPGNEALKLELSVIFEYIVSTHVVSGLRIGNILVCLLLFHLLLLFRLLNVFTCLLLFAALLLNFDLPRCCMPFLKFFGVFFKEHPLTSYDVQIHFCFSWKHFFMGCRRGMFHSTLNLNSV